MPPTIAYSQPLIPEFFPKCLFIFDGLNNKFVKKGSFVKKLKINNNQYLHEK